jgi:hypothetical protein
VNENRLKNEKNIYIKEIIYRLYNYIMISIWSAKYCVSRAADIAINIHLVRWAAFSDFMNKVFCRKVAEIFPFTYLPRNFSSLKRREAFTKTRTNAILYCYLPVRSSSCPYLCNKATFSRIMRSYFIHSGSSQTSNWTRIERIYDSQSSCRDKYCLQAQIIFL